MSDPTQSAADTVPLPPGEQTGGQVGPYKILQKLGEGGFGAVFEADQEHPVRRRVALKIIKLGMDTREVIARFEAERQALAMMDHPHIARVLDAGATESGRPYFVMELVRGEPISTYCDKARLSIAERLQLFTQVCAAVQHAHGKGIIHRDLKPSNVLVSTQDDAPFAKVIDFGIAKATSGRLTDATLFTGIGQVMGTPQYMSPEQAAGDSDIDLRTDVYALGVLLYELLTSTTPVESRSIRNAGLAEVQRMICEVDPPRPSARLSQATVQQAGVASSRGLAPRQLIGMIRGELDRVVMKAIEKDRARRYDSAGALSADVRRYLVGEPVLAVGPGAGNRLLRLARRYKARAVAAMLVLAALGVFAFERFGPAPGASPPSHAASRPASATAAQDPKPGGVDTLVQAYGDRSIAVLPFVNMSSDKEQEYFSDGISEELINQLGKIPALRVIARSSSFSFKGKDTKIEQIARELRVAHILEGSVRKSGNKIRITAELIRSADSSQLWSETYDRSLDDVFAVQDEISGAVVNQLKLKLLGDVPKARVTDAKAYALFLQARQLSRQTTAASLAQAVSDYRQALAIDPGYAAAWSGLSEAYTRQADRSLAPIEESYRLALQAANKALALDPDLASAHASLAWVVMPTDLPAAAQHLTRALALDSNDADALHSAAYLAMDLGHLDTAIAIGESMVARDPVGATSHGSLGFIYQQAHRPEAAIASFRTTLALSPGEVLAHVSIGMELLHLGQPRAALAEMQQETSEPARLVGLSIASHALGMRAESDAALGEAIRKYDRAVAYWIAVAYADRGDTDHAFEWLGKAVVNKDPGLSEVGSQPAFDIMHRDRRWLPFLRKLGKAPEQLAAVRFDVVLPSTTAGL